MLVVVPTYINDFVLSTSDYWKKKFPNNLDKARSCHKIANRVYWRTILAESQNHKCCWCGVNMTYEYSRKSKLASTCATIEHIIPKSKNGPNSVSNYAVSCYRCNTRRKDSSATDFMKSLGKKMSPEDIFYLDNLHQIGG